MYGLVNEMLQDLVSREQGDTAWEQVVARVESSAKPRTDGLHPGETTRFLLEAAAELLDIPVDQLLRRLGASWLGYLDHTGHGDVLAATGRSFGEVVTSLADLMGAVRARSPAMTSPALSGAEIDHDTYHVHCRTDSPALWPFAAGFLEDLADRFDLDAAVSHHPSPALHPDDDVFVVEIR